MNNSPTFDLPHLTLRRRLAALSAGLRAALRAFRATRTKR
jgi:hypothetical protein